MAKEELVGLLDQLSIEALESDDYRQRVYADQCLVLAHLHILAHFIHGMGWKRAMGGDQRVDLA